MKRIKNFRISNQFIKSFVVYIVLFAIAFTFYPITEYKYFMGDDLVHLNLIQNNNLSVYLTKTHEMSKYRPFFEIPFYFIIKAFNKNILPYMLINSFLISLSSFILYNFIKNNISGNKLIAFTSAIALITNRFGSYHQLQILGIMENLCILQLLLLTIFNINIIKNEYKINKYDYLALIVSFSIIFTHERFILAIIPTFTIYLYKFIKSKKYKFLLYSIAPFIFILLNIILKQKAGVYFLTAGETRAFKFNTDIINFFIKAVLNIIGINIGPSYLSGQNFIESPIIINLLPILFIPLLVVNTIKKDKVNCKIMIYILTLLIFLLISSSISFRQEFRFIYAPYLIFLIYINYLFSSKNTKTNSKTFLYFFLVIQIIGSLYYRTKLKNIYFMSGIDTVNKTEKIIKNYQNNGNKNNDIVLISNSDDQKWYFINRDFFDIYHPNKFSNIIYLRLDEANNYLFNKEKTQYLEINYFLNNLTYKIY